VLYARVHEGKEPGSAVTWLTRYAFEGGRWVEHQRQVPVGSEFDGEQHALPAPGEFP